MSSETEVKAFGKPTFILDIDGCILFTHSKLSAQLSEELDVLPGVKELFDYLSSTGSRVVLLTGRPESARERTEAQLRKHGLWWDQLVMISSNGKRILVNDTKPNSDAPTAIGITLNRNAGMEQILRDLKEGKL